MLGKSKITNKQKFLFGAHFQSAEKHPKTSPSQEASVELKNIKYECLKKSGYGTTPAGYESVANSGYRYGWQGQEKDDEWKGSRNSINYKYRVHDPRIGRFLSVDPLAPDFAHNSPYAFSENRIMDAIELEGMEAIKPPPPGMNYGDYSPTTQATAESNQAKMNQGQQVFNIPFKCPTGTCSGFDYYLQKPDLVVAMTTTVTPLPPPTGGTPIPNTTSSNSAFNPDLPTLTPGAGAVIAAVAATVTNTTTRVPNGAPVISPRTMAITRNSQNLNTSTFIDVSTQSVTTTTVRSTVTISFSTSLAGNTADRALMANRFATVSAALIAQGVNASDIINGGTTFGVARGTLTNNNQTNFTVNTTTSSSTGNQTTTTVRTETQTIPQ